MMRKAKQGKTVANPMGASLLEEEPADEVPARSHPPLARRIHSRTPAPHAIAPTHASHPVGRVHRSTSSRYLVPFRKKETWETNGTHALPSCAGHG